MSQENQWNDWSDDDAAADENEPEQPDEHSHDEPQLYYPNLDAFVRDHLRHVYSRHISSRGGGRVWAGRWWAYPEAQARLEALWRAWEHLRIEPELGMSVWWRDHADHHMAMLMDKDSSPFADCNGPEDSNRRGEPLPYVEPPAGMFTDEA